MDSKIKLLVVGDVRGRFRQFFQRLDTVNKKAGPFEIVLCVGEFFGTESQNDELIAYKNGNLLIPVPVYILGPSTKETVKFYKAIENGEICSNLTYLGKRGLYTLSSGVKIAYLSGVESQTGNLSNDHEEHLFDNNDIISVRNSCLINKNSVNEYKGIDMLLTSQWPWGILEKNENTSKLISYLCKEIRPRYHFCGLLGRFYESPPFRIPADQSTGLDLCIRFIALADIGNKLKEKNIYALSLTPVEKMRVLELIQKTTNEEVSPYLSIDFDASCSGLQKSDSKQYFFDMDGSGNDGSRKRPNHNNQQNKRPKIQNIEQEKCWFCLSSADVEKHLVITIGEQFYLALAKGPINNYHVLIVSITHIRCASMLSDEQWDELNRFKKSLKKFFKSKGQVVCFTERQYKTSHLQINVIGIDEGYAWKIQHSFEDKAEEFNLEFEALPALKSKEMLPERGPYFVAELPNETTLLTRQMKHFPLHFARDVFCSENLLNCDEKVDWKNCKLEKDEEIKLVENFRKEYSEFDFSM